MTTTSSWVGPSRCRASPSRPSSRGRRAAPRAGRACAASIRRSRRSRTSRPLVALLKCETTLRRPSTSCSTRTVDHPLGRVLRRSPERRVAAGAQVDHERRRRRPPRRRARGGGSSAGATGPRPGSETGPESRYAGMRSAGRSRPKSPEVMASRPVARRRAAPSSEAQVERLVEDAACRPGRPAPSARVPSAALRVTSSAWVGPRPRTAAAVRPAVPSCTGRRARRAPRPEARAGPGSSASRGRAACRGGGRTCLPRAAGGSARGPP